MRKFLLIVTLIIIAVSLTAALIFGLLYSDIYQKNELLIIEKTRLAFDLENLTIQNQTKNRNKSVFIDEGFGIRLEYPASWQGNLITKVSAGPVLDSYKFVLTKNEMKIIFNKIFNPNMNGGFGLSTNEYYYKIFEENELVRYSLKAENNIFKYGTKIDCSSLSNEQSKGATVCVDLFFLGFGKSYPSTVELENVDTNLLDEADSIVIGALEKNDK